MGIPSCLWRRTGEIYKGNKEFAALGASASPSLACTFSPSLTLPLSCAQSASRSSTCRAASSPSTSSWPKRAPSTTGRSTATCARLSLSPSPAAPCLSLTLDSDFLVRRSRSTAGRRPSSRRASSSTSRSSRASGERPAPTRAGSPRRPWSARASPSCVSLPLSLRSAGQRLSLGDVDRSLSCLQEADPTSLALQTIRRDSYGIPSLIVGNFIRL